MLVAYIKNEKRRATAFFCGSEGWFNTKKSWFNGKSCERIWWVIIFDISLQSEAIECLGKRSLTENLL